MGTDTEIERLERALASARSRIADLENVVDEDPLVPVLNRRGFVRELERTIAYVRRYGTQASLIYFDIDEFKSINDAHGHAAGDAALMLLGRLLVENVRRSDLVGRLGGDEFAVVLHRADAVQAARKAETLAAIVAGTGLAPDGPDIVIGLSWGVAELSLTDRAADVLSRADKAMYARKLGGKR